jgi:hypothetical protein
VLIFIIHLKPESINPISNPGPGFLNREILNNTETEKGTFLKNIQAPQETVSVCQAGLKIMKVIHFFPFLGPFWRF